MAGNLNNEGYNFIPKIIDKEYHSPRISSEANDCSMPLTFDLYSKCTFNCHYCFSSMQSANNPSCKGNTKFGAVNIKKLIKVMSGQYPDNPYYKNFFKHRFLLHIGGLSEPFCYAEEIHHRCYELLEYLAAEKYPTVFSSKGYYMFLTKKKNKKYLKLFQDSAKNNNFAFAHSIICDSDKTGKLIEPNVPSVTKRIEAIKILADLGYWNVLRLRPFIIGISDIGLESLLERSAKAGAKAISTEFFALDSRCAKLLDTNIQEISKITGIDYYNYLKKLSPTERGGYMRANRDVKEHYVKRMYVKCKEVGMQFNISDPDFKELNQSPSCCGLETNPSNPEMANYTKGQLTHHLAELRKRYWASGGKDKYLTWEMVEKDIANNWMDDLGYYSDSIKFWDVDYSLKTGHKQEFQNTWNNLRSAANPQNYFHGKIVASGVDKRNMIIYEYKPHPYEIRWAKEGIL